MKKFVMIFLSILLSSCAAIAVVGAVGGLIVYDKRDAITISEDHTIRHHIHKRIVRDPDLRNSHIVVSSFDHVVLLVGQTSHASLRVKAEKIAGSQPKVRRIYNEIKIGKSTSLVTRNQDIWITTKVKTQMLTKKGLRSGQIKVVTENREVYLVGTVTRKQASLAVDVARRVNGVRRVVKVFQYKD